MSASTSPRVRRAAGLAGLLGTAVLLVAGRAATAPSTHPAVLAGPGPTQPPTPSPGTGSTGTSAAAPPAPAAAPTAHAAAPPAPAAAPPVGPTTVLGRPEDANYGTVQVRLTLSGGRITDVQAVQLPSGGRSSAISAYAAPRLRTEVLDAQSAHIDTVSGASYTSDGYARSVQSALDAAPH